MLAVFSIVAPIFALIAVGYLAGRFNWVGPQTAKGLADFTFSLAIPAMLFRAMALTEFPDVPVEKLWAAFFGSALAVWIVAAATAVLILRRPLADSPPISMSAGFGNVVMLGIPLSVTAFGPDAVAPGALIVSLHSPLLWVIAAIHMASVNRDGKTSPLDLAGGIARDLSRNIIILAIIAGTLWRLSGIALPEVADHAIRLLGQAGIPCALVALGLSLVGFQIKGQVPTLGMILILKMIAMPVTAWYLAVHVLELAPVEAGVCILFAAMPTGANAYLFAVQHGRAMNSASGAVALGTLLSAFTAAAAVYILKVPA
jgi:malonate transporter